MSMASQISTMDQLTDYLGIPFSGLPFSKMGYIPSYLRTDVNCFKPSVVSIGPYFRHFSLKIEDAIKLQMASDLIQPESFNTFKSKMEKVIEKGMSYYPEKVVDKCLKHKNIEVTRDNRIKIFRIILFLDSCFIVRLIEMVLIGEEDDKLPFSSMIARRCIRDLILLENQIPWVVLKEIFLARYGSDHYVHRQLTLFANLVFSGSSSENFVDSETFCSDLIHVFQQNPVHLLDILRRKIIRFPNTKHHSCTRVNSLGGSLASASKMRSWGISFAVQGNLEMRRITFKNGCFHLPKLFICEFSESLFVNLMAYEYSFGIKGNDEISTYMWLMGLWLSDEESVSILRNNVVLSLYSDEKIVQLFKRMTQERMPNMKLLEVTHGLVPNIQLLEEVVKLTKIYQDSNVMLLRRWAFKIQEICFSSIWRTVACVSVFVMTIKQIVGVTCKG